MSKRLDRIEKALDRLEKESEKSRKELQKWGIFFGDKAEATFEQATEKGLIVEGIKFKQNATNYRVYDAQQNPIAEIDILMTGGNYVLLIEVKHNLPLTSRNERENIQKLHNAFDRKVAALLEHESEFFKSKKNHKSLCNGRYQEIKRKTLFRFGLSDSDSQ